MQDTPRSISLLLLLLLLLKREQMSKNGRKKTFLKIPDLEHFKPNPVLFILKSSIAGPEPDPDP
jgi:hypothetical protein